MRGERKLLEGEAKVSEAVGGRGVALRSCLEARRCARKLYGDARAARALCSGGGAAWVWEAAGQAAPKLLKEAGKRDIA